METKRCSKCGQVKSLIEFHRKHDAKGGYNSQCKSCKSKYMSYWRKTSSGLERRKQSRTRVYADLWLSAVSAYGGACKVCGERRPKALVLHHPDGDGRKYRETIGKADKHLVWLRNNGYPSVVELLCGTCHLIHHREREVT